MSGKVFVAEYVLPGHPDKLCDAIADALVEEAGQRERRALCGIEVAVHRASVFVTGRIACRDAKMIDVARTVGASPMQIATRVYLPAIAGQVFSGIRIGMGAAATGALLAETKIAKAGLGFMIVEYYGQFRIADMYSLLLFVFILAALTNWAMKTLFARLSPLARVNQDAGMYI